MTIAEFVNRVGFEVKQEDVKEVNNAIIGLKGTATKLLGAIGISFSLYGIKNAIDSCVALASEAEEMQNKFSVVFQGMNEEVENWARNYADTIGRNANDIKTYLADAQNLLVGFMGTDMRREAAEMAESMTTLALDLASFSNIDERVAVNAMQKAVMGESEAAKTIGAVLNESSRAQAMLTLGLQGSYDALDQATKMQVNYQAILEQSPDAIGDCERSVNSYRSTMLAYQAKQKEINTLIGQFFMPTMQKVFRLGTYGLTIVRDFVKGINEFAESIGGANRIIMVFGATLAFAFAGSAIKNGPALLLRLNERLRPILNAIRAIRAPAIAAVGAFLLLALAIDDFIAFMNGDSSMIGLMLRKAGISVDETREKFKNFFGACKQMLKDFVGGFAEGFKSTFRFIGNLIGQHGDKILAVGGKIIGLVADFIDWLAKLMTGIDDITSTSEGLGQILGVLASMFLVLFPLFNVGMKLATGLSGGLTLLTKGFGLVKAGGTALIGAIGGLSPPMLIAIAVIGALIIAGIALWKNWDKIKAYGRELLSSLMETWENIKSGVKEKANAVKDSAVEAVNGAIEFITSLPARAVQWGIDIIDGIVSGIKNAASRVKDSVSDVADEIKSFLGFSVPDEGPLSDFDTYMPDMINLMTKGIQTGRTKVKEAVTALAGDLGLLGDGGTVNVEASARPEHGGEEADTDTPDKPDPSRGGAPRPVTASTRSESETSKALATAVNVFRTSAVILREAAVSIGGIGAARGLLVNAVSKLNAAVAANSVSARTVSSVTHNSSNRSVTQNVEINNQFNGDTAIQKKAATAMDKSARDTTAELARGLAYAR